MRNLKKALAMVLALMMAVSLMSFASASDYADGGKIEKTEAVEVMSMINVFQGTDGGNFDPEGNLTRAQAAKIISYMKLGSAVADALPKDEAPFGDVKADRWYTGYVTYAKSEGIISGRSEQVFDPNGTVTGYEFGKMVLEAAGIKGEYTGTSSWTLNISTALRGGNPSKVNLMDGVDAVLSSPITREAACQLAFNALNYPPQGEVTEYVVTASDGTTVLYRGSSALEAYVIQSANGSSTLAQSTTYPGSLGETVFDLVRTKNSSTKDAFGAPATVWSVKNTSKSVVLADAATLHYTEKVTGDKIFADLGRPAGLTPLTAADVTIDNKAASNLQGDLNSADAFALARDNEGTIGGNGTVVDVYRDGNNVDIVVKNTFVTTIKAHTPANEKTGTKESITLTAGDLVYTTDNFTADDVDSVVLYTKVWNSTNAAYVVKSVAVPAEVKGVVTRSTASNFVLGGTTYSYSDNADGGNKVTSLYVTNKANATIYLDNYGYVVYATAEEVVSTTDAVLLDHAKSGAWTGDATYQVKLLLTDGSIVEKTLGKVGGSAPANESAVEALHNKIVKYSEKDGVVDVTVYTDATTDDGASTKSGLITDVTENKIVRNRPALGANAVANSKTIFLVGSEDGKTLKVYTGISAVPSIKELSAGGSPEFQVLVKSDVATLVYIAKSELVETGVESTDIIFVAGASSASVTDELGTYNEYDAVVNGEATKLKVDPSAEKDDTPLVNSLGAGKSVLLSSITTDDNGIVIGWNEITTGDAYILNKTSNSKLASGNLTIGDTTYVTNDKTVAFTVTGGKIEAVELDKLAANESGVKVTAYKDKSNVLVAVFVVTDPAATVVAHTCSWVQVSAKIANCHEAGGAAYYHCDDSSCPNGNYSVKKENSDGTGNDITWTTNASNHDGVASWSAATEAGDGYSAGDHIQTCGGCQAVLQHHPDGDTNGTGCGLGTCT